MPPPLPTPEHILQYGNQQRRPIRLDANVVAYIGYTLSKRLPARAAPPEETARKGRAYTASAQSRS